MSCALVVAGVSGRVKSIDLGDPRSSEAAGCLAKLNREADRGNLLQTSWNFECLVGVFKDIVVSGEGKGREKLRLEECCSLLPASNSIDFEVCSMHAREP